MKTHIFFLIIIIVQMSCRDNIIPVPDERPIPMDDAPAWSPDGKWIAYTHLSVTIDDSVYPTGLYLIDAIGNNRRLIIAGPAYNADWSPDGGKIAFNSAEIFTISSTGDSLTQITNVGAAFFPSWSPDGARIAFDTPYNDSNGANAIWIVGADGRTLHDISQHGNGEWREPCWRPRANDLLHIRYVSGLVGEELFIMDTIGQNSLRLTHNSIVDRNPKWSPDGLTIAWNSGDAIWLMNADGSNQRILVGNNAAHPSWSPNSRELVFEKLNARRDRIVLWKMDMDRSTLLQLTH